MKKILFLLTVVIIASSLLVSCSDKAEETSLPPEHQTIEVSSENTGKVSQDYPISSSSDITLTGLEEGKLYGIYPETGEARSELMARSTNSSLIPTNGGTYLYYADGGDFTFTGSDVGINGIGSVKLIEYEAETLEQEPTDSDFTIDTETEPCLFENSYGEKVYEEIYAVTIDEGFNPQNIAIALYHKGDASKSDDFGYINPETGKMERNPGRMSFSKGDTVLLFNQVFLREGYTKQKIVIQSPEKLELNKSVEVVPQQNIFEINKNTSDEYVLEITGVSKNDLQQLEFHYSAVASIYADGGRRYENIVPLSYSETAPGTAVLYIGQVDSDILFPFMTYQDLDNVELKLRPIKEEEKNLIVKIDPDVNQYKDIPIKADSYFTPVFFNSSASDTNIWIKMTTDTGSSMRYIASHTSGFGYSQYGLNLDGGEVAKGRPVDIPECAWIINYENKEGTVRLYFSNSSDFPVSGSIMEIDASEFPTSLSDPVSLEGFSSVYLYNMYPGEVYGFRFSEPVIVDDDRLIPFDDNFYGYVATSSTVEFNLEELGVFADSIQVMKFEKSSELKFDSSTEPVVSDQDQNLYIKCFDVNLNSLQINRSKVVMLTTQDGKINERPNYYFFDSNTGMQLTFFEEGINDLSALNDILFVYAVKIKEGEKYSEDFTFVSPEEVRAGEKMNLNENNAFILPSISSEMVIEFDTEYRTTHIDSVWAEGDNVNESCPYFIPLVYNENSIFYAGCLDEKVFVCFPETADAAFMLREINDEEQDMLKRYEIDSLPFEISFTENDKMLTCIFPTDKNPEHAGPDISLETQNEKVFVSVVALPVEGEGYSTRGLDREIKSETLPENRVIQSIVIENFDGGSGRVIISR